jgi:hypothetical protein
MDEQLLKSSGLSVGIITGIGLLYKLIQAINNKRIRSTCNGKNIVDVVIDIHEATEEEKRPVVPLSFSNTGATPKPTPELTAEHTSRVPSEIKI